MLREYNGIEIPMRPNDGYINATKMCKAGGKEWTNFRQLKSTNEYLEALESVLGIPRTEITVSVQGGDPRRQGTWVHPRLASRLAQWISPEFAVIVDGWVLDLTAGKPVMVNEASHDGAITQGIAALMETSKVLIESQNRLVLGQAQLGDQMGELSLEVRRTDKKVDGLASDVGNLREQLELVRNKGRKDFTKASKAIYKQVIWERYQGRCPVYPEIQIMDDAKHLTKRNNRCEGAYDHYNRANVNSIREGWLISVKANVEFEKNSTLRSQLRHRFDTFQDYVAVYQLEHAGSQLKLNV
jgi:hypothetical protein